MSKSLLTQGKQNSEDSLCLENTRPLQNLISLRKGKYKSLSLYEEYSGSSEEKLYDQFIFTQSLVKSLKEVFILSQHTSPYPPNTEK